MAKRVVKEGSLVRFISDIELLADDVFKNGTRAEKMAMSKMLLPYCAQEMPKVLEHSGLDGEPIAGKIDVVIHAAGQQTNG